MGWAPFFFLWLLSGGNSRGGGGGSRPKPTPATDPFAFAPVVPPSSSAAPRAVPVSYSAAPSGQWLSYAPLNPTIVSRAQALLKDPSKHEVIEPDPTRPGKVVRFLRTKDSATGMTSVTAWKARDEETAARATSPGARVVTASHRAGRPKMRTRTAGDDT
jgi:hypothetical protein